MTILDATLARLEIAAPAAKLDANGFSSYYTDPTSATTPPYRTFKAAYTAALLVAKKNKRSNRASVYGVGAKADARICTITHVDEASKVSVRVSFVSKFSHLKDAVKKPAVKLKR